MPPQGREPGPSRSNSLDFTLHRSFGLGAHVDNLASRFSFGVNQPLLQLDPGLFRWILENSLAKRPELKPLIDFAIEYGRPVLHLPFIESGTQRLMPTLRMRDEEPGRRIIFEIPSLSPSLAEGSKTVEALASSLSTTPQQLYGRRFWLVYRNDGGLPFNPGAGSDQGPTAFLGLYVTWDQKQTGLTRLGWTVIDMRTPRGHLPNGATPSSDLTYQTDKGPYSGISSIDFTVTVRRGGEIKVDVNGKVGVDSAKWGKFVQDFIHKKVSDSPLFPWPDKNPEKPFGELGVAVLYSPNKVLSEEQFSWMRYDAKIEIGGGVNVGTQGTNAELEAKLVVRATTVQTPLGQVTVEYTKLGVFGRGFIRGNDGREKTIAGVEAGVRGGLNLQIGRLGIGLTGEYVVSTDPALQTGNPAGASTLWNPLSAPMGSNLQLGGPAGSHGQGGLVLTWSF